MRRFFILAVSASLVSCTSAGPSPEEGDEGSAAPTEESAGSAAASDEAAAEGDEAAMEPTAESDEAEAEGDEAAADPRVESVREEVALNLARIAEGAERYFAVEYADTMGDPVPHQFPLAIGPTPALEAQKRACEANDGEVPADPEMRSWSFSNPPGTWGALNFAIADAHRAVYGFESEGVEDAATFMAYGQADPACNGEVMRWQITGKIEGGAVVVGEIEQVAP